jgi:hypothetical protein
MPQHLQHHTALSSNKRASAHSRRLSRCALLILTTFACAMGNAADSTYVETFTCHDGPLKLNLPHTYPELTKLGALRRSSDGEVTRYDKYTVTYRTLEFQGMNLVVVVFSNDPNRYALSSMTVSSGPLSLSPLRIGQPAATRLRHKGYPPVPADGAWAVNGLADALSVKVRAGRIEQYSYTCYTG